MRIVRLLLEAVLPVPECGFFHWIKANEGHLGKTGYKEVRDPSRYMKGGSLLSETNVESRTFLPRRGQEHLHRKGVKILANEERSMRKT